MTQSTAPPLKLVFFGSGAFGLPTLQHLCEHPLQCEIRAVVSQPDRPAGRGRKLAPTPIAEWMAISHPSTPLIKCDDVNTTDSIRCLHKFEANAYVVIAFGQKMKPDLLRDTFAINLHGSLLPKYRGAAPINHAMLNNEPEAGITVITLADRMDAGYMLGKSATPIQPHETAGDLHDRLAELGPSLVSNVLESHRAGSVQYTSQNEDEATKAPKLNKKRDGTTSFDSPASAVRARIHGLNPWPGCAVQLGDAPDQIVKIGLVRDHPESSPDTQPGTILPNLHVACASGTLEILRIQPPGKRMMDFRDYLNAYDWRPDQHIGPLTT